MSSPRNGELTGIDELVDVMSKAENPDELTQHVTTDLLVDVAGDQAAVSANSVVYFFRAGQAPHRTAGWRLRESRISLAWQREG